MRNIPPRSHQVLGLNLTGTNLSILGALFDILHQLLFLIFELDPFSVELSLCLFQRALMFPQPLGRGHALAECPFDDLTWSRESVAER